jgi:hypothetical protein
MLKRASITLALATTPTDWLDLIYDFHLGNGNNGNVWGITNNRDTSRSQTFTYDALNRLLSAQNAGTDCTKTLPDGHTEYWGNRLRLRCLGQPQSETGDQVLGGEPERNGGRQ